MAPNNKQLSSPRQMSNIRQQYPLRILLQKDMQLATNFAELIDTIREYHDLGPGSSFAPIPLRLTTTIIHNRTSRRYYWSVDTTHNAVADPAYHVLRCKHTTHFFLH